MAQDFLITDELDAGRKLVETLLDRGFDVSLAFWVKEAEAQHWYLYLASPVYDDKGPIAAYRIVQSVVEVMPELGIDPFAVKLVSANDFMAEAARKVIEPKVPVGPFAVQNPKPYTGMTRFGGSTLGGVSIDGAYIYPPPKPGASA